MTIPVRSLTNRTRRILRAGLCACLLLLMAADVRINAQTTSRVEFHTFTSAALGITKNYNIYLPPGYDSSRARYPVVYFLRGHEREWFNSGEDGSRGGKNLRHVADTLLSQGQIGPMILVGPSTASSDNSIPGLGVDMLHPELTASAGIGTGRFEEYFIIDLLHHIDSTYRTVPDRSARGIDGFSLGGYTSVMMAVKHPELFGSVGCYDGTHMWYNLDDPRNPGTPPDDNTWMTTSMFNPAFGNPRDVEYMKQYNPANLLLAADSAGLAAIRTVKFFIHTAAYDGSQGNLDRGNHIVNTLLGKNILNGYADIRLTTTAIHNWYHADLHARSSLVRHWQTFQSATGADINGSPLPSRPGLEPNFPNPFNPTTTIRFSLPASGSVTLKVFDVLGREVTTLIDGRVAPGNHEVTFDGAGLPSGLYFCRLETIDDVRTGRMLLIK